MKKHLDWKRIGEWIKDYILAFYFVYKMLRDYPKIEKFINKTYFYHNGEGEK